MTGSRHAPDLDRVLAAVLFTDIVGSTATAAAQETPVGGDVSDAHDAMVRRQLARFRGREVKTMGDGFLATFDGPARAINAAIAIRAGARALGLDVRAGLHAGEIELYPAVTSGHLRSRRPTRAQRRRARGDPRLVDGQGSRRGIGIPFRARSLHQLKRCSGRMGDLFCRRL